MDRPHGALVPRQFGVELFDDVGAGGVAQPECPPELRALAVGDGHGVDLCAVAQLEPVLDPAQEPVGVGQLAGVVLVDVAGRAQLGEGGEGRRRPQVGIEPAVDELQQLDGELDVADAATPRFTSRSVSPRRARSASTSGLEVAQRPEIVGGEDPRPQAGAPPASSNAAPTSRIAGDRRGP